MFLLSNEAGFVVDMNIQVLHNKLLNNHMNKLWK